MKVLEFLKFEYHVYNHGYNTWTLLKLEVER